MVSAINIQLQSINLDAIKHTFFEMKEWMGKKIQVIQAKNWQIQIKDPALGVGAILMGDILVCHVAFMIAKLLQPDDNYFEYHGNNCYQAKLSLVFGICFAGGIFAVSRCTKVPLDAVSKVIVHIIGCSFGITSLAVLYGK